MTYRVVKRLNKQENYTLETNITGNKQWSEHSEHLWHNSGLMEETGIDNGKEVIDILKTEELEEAVKQ
jgi:hypothetical protein